MFGMVVTMTFDESTCDLRDTLHLSCILDTNQDGSGPDAVIRDPATLKTISNVNTFTCTEG